MPPQRGEAPWALLRAQQRAVVDRAVVTAYQSVSEGFTPPRHPHRNDCGTARVSVPAQILGQRPRLLTWHQVWRAGHQPLKDHLLCKDLATDQSGEAPQRALLRSPLAIPLATPLYVQRGLRVLLLSRLIQCARRDSNPQPLDPYREPALIMGADESGHAHLVLPGPPTPSGWCAHVPDGAGSSVSNPVSRSGPCHCGR